MPDPTPERNAAHTPGPWRVEPAVPGEASGVHVFAANPEGRATDVVTIADFIENEANACLIAAAPDLLEACRRLLKFNEELCEDTHVSTHYPSADYARAAIVKAEGQP